MGGRSSSGSTRWSNRERQLAGSPASQRFYAVVANLRQAILFSRHTGRSVVRWPRLPRVVGAAAGRSRPPGSSSSDSRPAATPRCGGLFELQDHCGLRGHSGSSGGQLSCGTQCATRDRQAASLAAGLPSGGLSEWPAPQLATRVVGWPARMRDSHRAIWESQAQAASPSAGLHCGGLSNLNLPQTDIRFAGTAPQGHCRQLTPQALTGPKSVVAGMKQLLQAGELILP